MFLLQKCAGHFCRETTIDNNKFSKLLLLFLSNSHLIRQSESALPSLNRGVTSNNASSPFKQFLKKLFMIFMGNTF